MLAIFAILSCTLVSSLCMTVSPPGSQVCDSYNLTETLLSISNHTADENTVNIEPGNYTLDGIVTFNRTEISIIGNGDPTKIVISCKGLYAGLRFEMVSDLIMKNFTLLNCGSKVNQQIYSVLYMKECTDVSLSNIAIINTTQSVGLYATNLHGHCLFDHLVFTDNTNGGISLNFDENYSSKLSSNSSITSVEINACNFTSNTANSGNRNPLSGGGGLKVTLSRVNYQVNLKLIGSRFQDNSAEYGAGVLLYMTSPLYCNSVCPNATMGWSVSIEECLFTNNNAAYGGSALLVYSDSVVDGGSEFVISNCVFMNNSAGGNMYPPTLFPQQVNGTTVSIRNTNISLQGKNEFTLNYGSALEAISSQVSVCGDIYLLSNVATHGGGFRLLGNAYLLLYLNNKACNSSIHFTDNDAYVGIDIYVQIGRNEWQENFDPCFLHFDTNMLPSDKKTPVEHDKTIYKKLNERGFFSKLLGDSKNKNASSMVDSVLVYTPGNITVMPGQQLEVGVELLDKFEQPLSGVVSAMIVSPGDVGFVRGGPWLVNDQVTVVQMSLGGIPDQVVTLSVYELYTGVHTEFTVNIQPCLLGFVFDPESEQCRCDEELSSKGVYCDIGSGALNIPTTIWLGPLSSGNNYTLVIASCVEDYCKSSSTAISNNDFDFQCKPDRSGVGCGSCVTGYSAVFGSTQCQICTNYSLFMIVLFLITGLLTVTGILFLRITITEGYLNAVLFYCNMISAYAVYFVPAEHGKGAFFLAVWISQHFGIPACFFNGMTELGATGLHLLYIVYLFILTGLLSLLLRCKQLPRSDNFAPSKALATLLVICYIGLLETCLKILSFTEVRALDGELFIRWYFDANVEYFTGLHAVLVVVSILIILVFLIPFPFLTISPRITYKVRFFNKLQPLLDTFWAPFKPKFRWWISFRLFLRWIPFLVVSFAPASYSIVSVIMILAILHFLQSMVKPFKSYWQNVFDEALVLNAILLFCGYWFLYPNAVGLEIYSGVFVGAVYLVFGVSFVYFIFYRFPKCKPCLKSIPTEIRKIFSPRQVSDFQEFDNDIDPPNIVSHSEITISKEQKEQDKRNLIEEVLELESLTASESSPNSSPTHATVNPNARISNTGSSTTGRSHYRVSLTERTTDKNTFPLLNRKNSFTEDREPLLADDSQ